MSLLFRHSLGRRTISTIIQTMVTFCSMIASKENRRRSLTSFLGTGIFWTCLFHLFDYNLFSIFTIFSYSNCLRCYYTSMRGYGLWKCILGGCHVQLIVKALPPFFLPFFCCWTFHNKNSYNGQQYTCCQKLTDSAMTVLFFSTLQELVGKCVISEKHPLRL